MIHRVSNNTNETGESHWTHSRRVYGYTLATILPVGGRLVAEHAAAEFENAGGCALRPSQSLPANNVTRENFVVPRFSKFPINYTNENVYFFAIVEK